MVDQVLNYSLYNDEQKIEILIESLVQLKQRHIIGELKHAQAQSFAHDIYLEITNSLIMLNLESRVVEALILELANGALQDRFDLLHDKRIEKLKSFKKIKGFDLKICQDDTLLSPVGKKNKIILFIQNHFDGVGDFMHGVTFAQNLKSIVEDKYEICAVVKTTTSKTNQEVNSRAGQVKKILQSGNHHFDKWYLYESDYAATTKELDQWLQLPEQEKITETLSEAALGLEISTSFSQLDAFTKFLPPEVSVAYCGEYGHIRPESDFLNYADMLKDASMGLGKGSANYGIFLDEPKITSNNYQMKLLEMGGANRSPEFVQHLLGTPNPNVEDVDKYFNEHYFMPAYMQTKSGATAFILTQILKNYASEGELNRKCDFLIPKGVVDEVQIRDALRTYGFKDDDIAFVRADSPNMSHTNAKIRVMSFFIKDEQDYKALYNLAPVTGCSGDNTVSSSFSSFGLPYFEYKGSVFGEFCKDQLQFTLDEEIRRSNGEYQQGLINLRNYFDCLCKNVQYDKDNPNAFFEWCITVANLSNQPNVDMAWRSFRELLFTKYNYNNSFPAIVKTLLNLSRPGTDIMQLFAHSDKVVALKEMGILDEGAAYDPENLISLTTLANPFIIQGVGLGYFDPKLLKMDLEAHLPVRMSWFDTLEIYRRARDKIFQQPYWLDVNHARKLILAMRLKFDAIDPIAFDACFRDPKILDDYLKSNHDRIINDVQGMIENNDVMAVHIWVENFITDQPADIEAILNKLASVGKEKYYNNIESAQKYSAMIEKVFSLPNEQFQNKIITALVQGANEGTHSEFALLALMKGKMLTTQSRDRVNDVLDKRIKRGEISEKYAQKFTLSQATVDVATTPRKP